MTFKRKKIVVILSSLAIVVCLFVLLRNRLLCYAAKHGHSGAVRILATLGASVDGKDGSKRDLIPLHTAIYNRHRAIARYLIAKGASVRTSNKLNESAFTLAIYESYDSTSQDYFDFLSELLLLGIDINARDNEGRTALMHVYDTTLAKFLLAHGADVNLKDNEGNSVLHVLYESKIVPLLLRSGADATVRNNYGQTPIHYLTYRSGPGKQGLKNVELMIQAGLDPRAKDNSGNLAITKAIMDGKDDLVTLLERHGGGETMTPELEAARDRELAGMLFRRMHVLPRAKDCQVTLHNGERMAEHGRQIFGVKGETVEVRGECPSGGVLHGVVYGNGKVFYEFLNLSVGVGGLKPLSGTQGPVAFTLTPEMRQTEVAWVMTQKPAASIRLALQQASAALVSKHRVQVGRRGN